MKKVLSIFSAILLVMSIGLVTAFAIEKPRHNLHTAHLTTSDRYKESSRAKGTYKYYSAVNSTSSKHSVRVDVKYSTGSSYKSKYHTNLNAGHSWSLQKTGKQDQSGYWKISLDPFGATFTNCEAWGYIGDK